MRRVAGVHVLNAADDSPLGEVGIGAEVHQEAAADQTMLIEDRRHVDPGLHRQRQKPRPSSIDTAGPRQRLRAANWGEYRARPAGKT